MNTATPSHLVHLRVADLIAKTARVTLKDTLRVIAALDAVSYFMDKGPTDIVDEMDYSAERPEPSNVAACEQQFFEMRNRVHPHAERIRARMKTIKTLM